MKTQIHTLMLGRHVKLTADMTRKCRKAGEQAQIVNVYQAADRSLVYDLLFSDGIIETEITAAILEVIGS